MGMAVTLNIQLNEKWSCYMFICLCQICSFRRMFKSTGASPYPPYQTCFSLPKITNLACYSENLVNIVSGVFCARLKTDGVGIPLTPRNSSHTSSLAYFVALLVAFLCDAIP